MAPLPDSDHCISFDPVTAKYFVAFGPLFKLLQGTRWHLTPHAVTVLDDLAAAPQSSGGRPHSRAAAPPAAVARANAFVADSGSPGAVATFIYPVIHINSTRVTLQLRGLPDAVTGFEMTLPGANAGHFKPVFHAERGSTGHWSVTIQRPPSDNDELDGSATPWCAMVRSVAQTANIYR